MIYVESLQRRCRYRMPHTHVSHIAHICLVSKAKIQSKTECEQEERHGVLEVNRISMKNVGSAIADSQQQAIVRRTIVIKRARGAIESKRYEM